MNVQRPAAPSETDQTTDVPRPTQEEAEAAVRTEDWAFLLPLKVPDGETREPLLFEKPDDRWEVNDLRPRNVERADELEAELRKAIQLPGGSSRPSG